LGGDGGESGSFHIVRDGEEQGYDGTTILLRDEALQWVLRAANYADPVPDGVDDEYADVLRIVLGKEALAELVIDEDYPISGVASWPETGLDSIIQYLDQVSFGSSQLHTVVIEHIFFYRVCGFCGTPAGAQRIQGKLRLTTNAAPRLVGLIEVLIRGDVPGLYEDAQLHELTLVFDLDADAMRMVRR